MNELELGILNVLYAFWGVLVEGYGMYRDGYV